MEALSSDVRANFEMQGSNSNGPNELTAHSSVTWIPGPIPMIVCTYASSVQPVSTSPLRQTTGTRAAAVTGPRQLSFPVINV